MRITIQDESKYDITIRELLEDPKQDYPSELDVTITIDGELYSGTLTKDLK